MISLTCPFFTSPITCETETVCSLPYGAPRPAKRKNDERMMNPYKRSVFHDDLSLNLPSFFEGFEETFFLPFTAIMRHSIPQKLQAIQSACRQTRPSSQTRRYHSIPPERRSCLVSPSTANPAYLLCTRKEFFV